VRTSPQGAPLIGITTSIAPVGRHGLPHVMLGAQYLHAVEAAGAVALPLTPAHEQRSLDLLLERIDALVLSGGEDIDPARYGQHPHPALGAITPARDEMEFHVLEGAIRRGLPILAICRGMQLLNVAWGGTLFQDLPSQRPGPIAHRQQAAIHQTAHEVSVAPDSVLRSIVGVDSLDVNSFHHQGIDRLAAGLRAVAWAEDGLIEAVESTDGRWIVGVQWHPERGEAEARGGPNPNAALFTHLVEECRSKKL
jgi:putative glutamine amidotransferase